MKIVKKVRKTDSGRESKKKFCGTEKERSASGKEKERRNNENLD